MVLMGTYVPRRRRYGCILPIASVESVFGTVACTFNKAWWCVRCIANRKFMYSQWWLVAAVAIPFVNRNNISMRLSLFYIVVQCTTWPSCSRHRVILNRRQATQVDACASAFLVHSRRVGKYFSYTRLKYWDETIIYISGRTKHGNHVSHGRGTRRHLKFNVKFESFCAVDEFAVCRISVYVVVCVKSMSDKWVISLKRGFPWMLFSEHEGKLTCWTYIAKRFIWYV